MGREDNIAVDRALAMPTNTTFPKIESWTLSVKAMRRGPLVSS